eukprot:CAMPEP_0119318610 /NCGR_PEP_ID=MMETSP1333-20130426/46951_1 /TAXON_ID=418940 /ORGANISM="Scyphosphaera apsteinii, Strain RCC1455" /LENGTH=97 /DNA_ID=CAMNT_0007324829 /DNA_START=53 /DNA_END=346 /DNA_ORIENTATION=+
MTSNGTDAARMEGIMMGMKCMQSQVSTPVATPPATMMEASPQAAQTGFQAGMVAPAQPYGAVNGQVMQTQAGYHMPQSPNHQGYYGPPSGPMIYRFQ